MSSQIAKSFLLETITSIFHENIIPEVKLNITELHQYFDTKGETYRALLNVIEDHDSNQITKLIIKDALISEANRSEDEANNIVTRVVEARKLNDDEVDKIRKRLKDICYQTYIEYARKAAGDDLERYSKLIATYAYKDLGATKLIIKDIGELDVTTLTEKYLENPIKSHYSFINNCFAGRGGYLRQSLVLVCGRPKSGKSMFLMTEAVNFAMQGYKVHYLALGDLNELDFIARMAAIETNTSLEVVYSDVKKYRDILISRIRECGGVISISTFPAGKLTPEEYYNVAINRLKGYDVLIIDYDLNFLMTSDNQYTRGGELYDLLSDIKTQSEGLVMPATQPNRSYWGEEFLDDTCFIESSKKSMIVDAAVTIGKNSISGTHCGYINVPIQRRGHSVYRPYIMANTGELFVVPESAYATYSGDKTTRDFSYKELSMLASMRDDSEE